MDAYVYFQRVMHDHMNANDMKAKAEEMGVNQRNL